MASTPPANAPTGPKVSSTRTIVSLILLLIVLVVCGIEMRAGLGQFLTMRSFDKVSENNMFKDVSFADAQGMLAAFPSELSVEVLPVEDVHHYQWFSLLRPLMGQESPEMYVTADHGDPPKALTFYTAIEDHEYESAAPPEFMDESEETGESEPAPSHDDTDAAQAPESDTKESDTPEEPK